MKYAVSRRSFLAAVGTTSALAGMLRSAEARAAGTPVQRLILSLRPCGTIRSQWVPTGTGRTFTFNSILKPLEPYKDKVVVLDGLNNVTDGAHESGLLGMVTGTNSPNGLYGLGGRASFDQVLLNAVPALSGAPVKSLQVAGDTRCDHAVQRVVSYSGPRTPLEPDNDPARVYRRLFTSFMPGADSATAANEEKLQRARARKASVLDFAKRDLDRLSKIMPASEREKLDAHTAVIRDMEQALDHAPKPPMGPGACMVPMAPDAVATNSNQNHAKICGLMSKIVGAALACDRTRVVSITWAPVTSALAGMLRSAEARAAGTPVQRLILSLRPCGTIRSQWVPTGTGRTFTFNSILKPLEPYKDKVVVLDGLNNVTDGAHESGLLGMVTGTNSPNGLYGLGGRASFDQVLLNAVPALSGAPVKSLQVAGDTRCDHAVQRVVSYSGPRTPLEPDNDPARVYRRLFTSFMPGADSATAANEEKLQRARARKASVLDFAKRDLDRLSKIMPASEREKLDAHTAVIRDMEQALDQAPKPPMGPGACMVPMAPDAVATNSNQNHAKICGLMSKIVGAALACDRTRVVSITWAPVTSHVAMSSMVPGRNEEYHEFSHGPLSSASVWQPLAAVEKFYVERVAEIVKTLTDVGDGAGGNLMDSTLIVHFSETAHGGHSPTNMPIALIGGKGVKLNGGQAMTFGGRPTSDMWMGIGSAFGVNMAPHLSHNGRNFTALPGVFVG